MSYIEKASVSSKKIKNSQKYWTGLFDFKSALWNLNHLICCFASLFQARRFWWGWSPEFIKEEKQNGDKFVEKTFEEYNEESYWLCRRVSINLYWFYKALGIFFVSFITNQILIRTTFLKENLGWISNKAGAHITITCGTGLYALDSTLHYSNYITEMAEYCRSLSWSFHRDASFPITTMSSRNHWISRKLWIESRMER